MKKRLAVVLSVLLSVALLMTGCELLEEPFPEGADEFAESGEIPRPTAPSETLSPEDEALAELAAEALWGQIHGLPEREHFEAEVSHHVSNGTARVSFTLHIGGYRTHESYDVRISAEGEVTGIDGGFHSYRQFVANATPDRISAAEAVLDERLKEYGGKHSGYYLTVDDEGYLCLSCEVIVYLDGPAFGEGGCGIDHEHKFFNQRICPAP